MPQRRDQIRLGAFLQPTGHHVASWRHPGSEPDAGINIDHYVRCAQTAERGRFDMVFLADNICVRNAHIDAISRSAQYIANFEPLTLLSALAMVTSRIGLVATASTSYNEPYHVARKFASLDHISHGRAGWNLVTSGQDAEARNFNREAHYEHGERYRRASEFAEVVLGLWDSWDDDAFLRDPKSGLFFHPDKMHKLHHRGEHFKVLGPLNVPRSPQGRPVLVQAGGSEDMIGVASGVAEVIFCSPYSVADGASFYRTLKGRMIDHGRDPDTMKIMPGLSCILGATEAEADAKYEELQSLIHPIVAREILSTVLGGQDLSGYDLDAPVPDIPPPETGATSSYERAMDLGRKEGLTLMQLALRMAGARGKHVVKGTPEQIADLMEDWFDNRACDGFNIMPPYLPGALEEFVEMVVPELQRRGRFRTEYEGTTLRQHLGLPYPESRYVKRKAEAAE